MKPNFVSGNNYADVFFDNLRLYFSYSTPIAFWTPETGQVVRQNDWGPTTGKHLNAIDGGNKKARINGEEFEWQLNEVLASLKLSN